MKKPNDFTSFQFAPRSWGISPKLMTIAIVLISFILIWRVASATAVFWLLFFIQGTLTWVASFGWRQALTSLIRFLERLTF